MEHSCPRDWLCDTCLERHCAQMYGVAIGRGRRWAEKVSRAVFLSPPPSSWPAHEDKAAEIARRWVRNLTNDPRALELLAEYCAESARERWAEIQRGIPAHVPFFGFNSGPRTR